MKKKILLPTIIVLLLCGIFYIFFFGRSDDKVILLSDNNAEEWEGNQQLMTGIKSETKSIRIPGFESLAFYAGQKTQKVNFFNPEENECLFKMSLLIDQQTYWQSEFVEPGKGFYEIELKEALKAGDYAGSLLIECYDKEGKALNNARVEFNTKVVE